MLPESQIDRLARARGPIQGHARIDRAPGFEMINARDRLLYTSRCSETRPAVMVGGALRELCAMRDRTRQDDVVGTIGIAAGGGNLDAWIEGRREVFANRKTSLADECSCCFCRGWAPVPPMPAISSSTR